MGGRIMGVKKGTDQDGGDKDGCHGPAQDKIFELLFCGDEKQKKRVDRQEISVSQSSSSAGIIIWHDDDKNQDLGEGGQKDQPLVQFFFLGKEQEQKKNGGKKVPG
jgi:hypothetical protein